MNEYDSVRLRCDLTGIEGRTWPAGTVGVVVEVGSTLSVDVGEGEESDNVIARPDQVEPADATTL